MQAQISTAIKSIQDVEFPWSFANNQASGGADVDQAITPVDTNRSIILLHESATTTGGYGEFNIQLTSSANARLHHEANISNPGRTAKAYVVEFKPGILKSIQQVDDSSNPQTISSVDTDKAIFIPLSFQAAGGYICGPCGASITSATMLEWKHNHVFCDVTCGMVVEFR